MNERVHQPVIDLDHFPCGCLITTRDRKILFANQFFADMLGWDPAVLLGQPIDILLQKSTRIFFESYVIPETFSNGRCSEVQIALASRTGETFPKTASVQLMPDGNLSWIFLEAVNRSRLFHELESARQALQEQREQLEQLALTDPLTGLTNRRGFEINGRDILARARRTGKPVSVLMLDVDHFKALNDTYGHDAGDKALCVLADILKLICRASDSVARLGGDEFACLLGDTDFGNAEFLCDRIRMAVEKTESFGCSVSIGIAELTDYSQIDLYEFLKQADEALYAVKRARSGRAKTIVATEPRPSVGDEPVLGDRTLAAPCRVNRLSLQ